jgi:hypothetical protein
MVGGLSVLTESGVWLAKGKRFFHAIAFEKMEQHAAGYKHIELVFR